VIEVYGDRIIFNGHSSYKSKTLVKRVIEMPICHIGEIIFEKPTFLASGKVIIENPYIDGFYIQLLRCGKDLKAARQMVETVNELKEKSVNEDGGATDSATPASGLENRVAQDGDRPGYRLSIIILNSKDLDFGRDTGIITVSREVRGSEERFVYSMEDGEIGTIDVSDAAMRRLTDPLRKGQVMKFIYGERTKSRNPRLFRIEYMPDAVNFSNNTGQFGNTIEK
jgi:hypothetical protein